MAGRYILAVDQSTQGTKGLLFDEAGVLVARADKLHAQHVNEKGWIEHDPKEILQNTLHVAQEVSKKAKIDKNNIAAVGISNQRETVMAWNKRTGEPLYNAIVWQCARAKDICDNLVEQAGIIKEKTGLKLSPYFSAAKLAWLMQNVPKVSEISQKDELCCGTMDSWLVWNLTKEQAFKTDYSNASRTQLFNINTLQWDADICRYFGVPLEALPQVCMSDSVFGHTDFGGWLNEAIPISGVLGDSHAALLGQNCRDKGSIKATYGTGSSVMMQTGAQQIKSEKGLVTSLAWGLAGKVEYVLEGNLNYTGAVITWLKNNLCVITEDAECEQLANMANKKDKTCFVPAFTGLGAPYWDSRATAILTGITRTTGKAEIVKACVDSIAFQIADIVDIAKSEAGIEVGRLCVDGGPTANKYLMQMQSDVTGSEILVPSLQELSGMGAAYAAGFALGVYNKDKIYGHIQHTRYKPKVSKENRAELMARWYRAVRQALAHE